MKTMNHTDQAAHVAQYLAGQQRFTLEQQVTKLLACVKSASRWEPTTPAGIASRQETIAKLTAQHAELAAALGELNAKMLEAAQLLGEV